MMPLDVVACPDDVLQDRTSTSTITSALWDVATIESDEWTVFTIISRNTLKSF